MKKKRKNNTGQQEPQWSKFVGLILFMLIIIPFIINMAYLIGKRYPIIVTPWSASDILAFYAAITSSIGTVVLGIVTLELNRRLVKLDEDTFIVTNAGAALLREAKIQGLKSNSCNFDLHIEQIVYSSELEQPDINRSASITITCKIQPLDNRQHAAYIRVKHAQIWLSQDTSTLIHLDCVGYEQYYTRVAISDPCDLFDLTVLMTTEQKQSFAAGLQKKCELHVSLDLQLVTDKSVESELRCDADMARCSWVPPRFITTDENPPKCFWKDARIINSCDINIKKVIKDEDDGKIKDADCEQG